MKIGCCAYSYRKYLESGQMDMEDFINMASCLGLDGVELTSYYFSRIDSAYMHSLKRMCLEHGVDVAGSAVGSRFTAAEPSERASQVEMTKNWIQHAVELGAPYLRVFAGDIPEGYSYDDAFAWAIEALFECEEVASQKGVVLALENHGGITTSAEQTLRLIEKIDSEWLRVNLDIGNFGMDVETDPYVAMEMVIPYAVTAHYKVSMRVPDGKKLVDIRRVAEMLRRVDYRGYLNIEYEEDEEPRHSIPKIVKELREV